MPALALSLLAIAVALGSSTAVANHSLVDLVSVGPNGEDATLGFFQGASEDGRLVFFSTPEALVPEDADGLCPNGYDPWTGEPIPSTPCIDIYVRDRTARTTRLISTGPNGNKPYHAKFAGATPDGSRVLIETREPLVSEDTDFGCYPEYFGGEPEGCPDLYEVVGGQTRFVSTGPSDPHGTSEVRYPRDGRSLFSPDGSRVYFMTSQPLVPQDADGCSESINQECQDAYVRSGDTITLISQGPNDSHQYFGGGSQTSADGRLAIFQSRENLAPQDTDHCAGSPPPAPCVDVYIRDLQAGTTELVSTGPNANQDFYQANSIGETGGVSADLRYVFFRTAEPITNDDVEGDSSSCAHDGLGDVGCNDIYRRDLQTGTTTLISTGPKKTGTGGTHTTDDAEFEFATADGQRVFFRTEEQLVDADTDGQTDIYEWSNGTTKLVSTSPNPANQAKAVGFLGSSLDGDWVFLSTTEPLLPSDHDTAGDVYRKSGNTLEHVSIGPIGGNAEIHANQFGGVSEPTPDGSSILFSTAESLVSEDGDSALDVYEWNEGTTSLLLQGVETPSGVTLAGWTPDLRHAFFNTNDALTAEDGDAAFDLYGATLNGLPSCAAVEPTRTVLHPANHSFRTVRIRGEGAGLTLEITGVTQDEQVGRTPNARAGTSPDAIRLRAERNSRADGRVYRIAFTASDGVNECSGVTRVEVRRKKNVPAVDSAPPSFDSFG